PSLSCQSISRCCFSERSIFSPWSWVSFAPRMSASVKSHSSKQDRRMSAFRKFVRTKATSLKIEARKSHRERSESVKLTLMKSFQQSVDSEKSVFLNDIGPISDLPKKVRGRVKLSRACSGISMSSSGLDAFNPKGRPTPTHVRKNETPSGSSSSHCGR